MTGRLILIGGGAHSGKSAYALKRATELGERRVFVATAQAFDEEMVRRIDAHRLERADAFETVEASRELAEALITIEEREPKAQVVVIDCLTMWLSNLLLDGHEEDEIDRRLCELLDRIERCPFDVLVVTNEVGMSLVPETPLGRAFRDISGRAHQRFAAQASEIYLAALGTVLRLHPAPAELVAPAALANRRTASGQRDQP